MKNLRSELLREGSKNLLNIFFTAGYPERDSTITILKALEDAGVDLVEIGIPFSDPLADGPTIQESSKQALANGMSIDLLFEQLAAYQDERSGSTMPKFLMGYLNPVMQYGMDRFLEKCSQVGVDGLIIPDLPLVVYQREYEASFRKNNISNVFLITPQTSERRIREIDELSTEFIYAVSSASTTGSKSNFTSAIDYLEKLKSLNLQTPVLTGFNIKTRADFLTACNYVDGAIIGSEFIRQISNTADLEKTITQFVESIKG